EESPNLTEPPTSTSRSEKNSRRPVMWCVAPKSRYQPSTLSSSEPLPRRHAARRGGVERWQAVPPDAAPCPRGGGTEPARHPTGPSRRGLGPHASAVGSPWLSGRRRLVPPWAYRR